ncbi:hypothetical protein [Archangium sp.]|uniref:hypothetical protein n=1 Tax=Archangium sp. TaxID=1872627 RepID=UPI002D4EEC00|nr:hypothetical protein [Archangium sp.]HYO55754.1 hypothetical protein [Archangium sp.]
MFTISKQQMQSLESALERRFVTRVIEYLKKHLPEEVARRERKALEEQVMADIQVAKGHDIRQDADLAKWCFMAFICGSKFYEAEDIREFLKEPLMSASVKVDYLMRSLAHTLASSEMKR